MNTPLPPIDTNSDDYRRARRQVRSLRGWYLHAMIYACVIGGLWLMYSFGLSTRVNPHGWPWPIAPTFGWGLGLAIHGFVVWTRVGSFGRSWEERKIRELMDRG